MTGDRLIERRVRRKKGNGREKEVKGGGENDLTQPLSQIPGYATALGLDENHGYGQRQL